MQKFLPILVLLSSLWYYYQYHKASIGLQIDKTKLNIESLILESWFSYKNNAFGNDIFTPAEPSNSENMTRTGQPLGWMIIDSLDTLTILYKDTDSIILKESILNELIDITNWCKDNLDYEIDSEVNLFETTIRMLGGLLSGYHVTRDIEQIDSQVFLDKAIDLADRLSLIFVSDSEFDNEKFVIPYSSINLATGFKRKNNWDAGSSSTAEFTTLQLEFKYLSFLTGNNTYWSQVESVYPVLYNANNLLSRDTWDSLVPIFTNPNNGKFFGRNIRFGSRGDTFYEYLLKQFLLTGDSFYYKLYRRAMDGMKRNLLRRHATPNKLTYIAERPEGLHSDLSAKMDHLVCFMGGLLAMGATHGNPINIAKNSTWWDNDHADDWLLAQELTYTCYQMYHQIPSGLAPEIVVFNDPASMETYEIHNSWWLSKDHDFYVKPLDAHNLQRPETVESLMYMYHLTNDTKYREWGQEIVNSFLKNSCINCDNPSERTYVSLNNVIDLPTTKRDNMESFWLAETLKYLHLLFQDNVDLTKIVFNTEAHPFPVLDKSTLDKMNLTTSWSIAIE